MWHDSSWEPHYQPTLILLCLNQQTEKPTTHFLNSKRILRAISRITASILLPRRYISISGIRLLIFSSKRKNQFSLEKTRQQRNRRKCSSNEFSLTHLNFSTPSCHLLLKKSGLSYSLKTLWRNGSS